MMTADGAFLAEKTIVLREGDDVVVAREEIIEGTVLVDAVGAEIRVNRTVPAGHKLAVRSRQPGDPVTKYGQVIGGATQNIAAGDWVHTHNLGVVPLSMDYRIGADAREPASTPYTGREFHGFLRRDGRAGTRNTVLIVTSVNCSADAAARITRRLREEALAGFPHVDDVVAVTHKTGCGMSGANADYVTLQRTLAGFAAHPNVAKSMLIGLGCEVNQPLALARNHGLIPLETDGSGWRGAGDLPPILGIQEIGGVRKAVDAGFQIGLTLLRQAEECRRTPQPISKLIVGTNCGGSDACSGITANPALGAAGDHIVAAGGTWVLGETSETYGAEHLLTSRAATPEVAERLLALMRWWEDYAKRNDAEIDNNPAPGNKAGGLTTIYEKSLGAVMKGGSSPLRAVYSFAERIEERGLVFMDTPGHDPVSVTGLVAGGCGLIAFTTGRGSCLGFKPAPVLKIATNTPLYKTMTDDMDIDAGVILNGVSIEDVSLEILERLIAMASGSKSKSESQGLGDETFAPWTMGPVL